jgi:hypothetical protein
MCPWAKGREAVLLDGSPANMVTLMLATGRSREDDHGADGSVHQGEQDGDELREQQPSDGSDAGGAFGKTGEAQSTALFEDSVERIHDLLTGTGEARPTDIARRLGVSRAPLSRQSRALSAQAWPSPAPTAACSSPKPGLRSRRASAPATGWWSTCCAASGVPAETAEGGRGRDRASRVGEDARGIRAVRRGSEK